MKRTGNKNLKIIAATMMTIFSLFTCFSAAAAWFIGVRNQNNEMDNFEVHDHNTTVSTITVHEFYGLTEDESEFGFNPTAQQTVVLSDSGETGTVGFEMGTYSLNDPHHPVLFLFQVTNGNQSITLNTQYAYLANDEPTETVTVATYSALGTYANGTIVKVTADEEHSGATTKYRYVILETGDPYFEMLWIDLRQNNNPLSSIVMTHYFMFTDDPRDSSGTYKTKTGELMIDDGEGNKTAQTKTYVPFTSSEFTDDNMSSFVTFDENRNPQFDSTAVVFEDSTTGYAYIGVVLDYYAESLEYIYSHFLGHTLLNAGLDFKCDWKMDV